MSFYSLRDNRHLGRLDDVGRQRDMADAGRIHDLMSIALGDRRADTVSSEFKRQVFGDYWERPRLGELRDYTPRTTGRYLALLPWSESAYLTFMLARANRAQSVTGLVLEHVTPLTALWDKLSEGFDDDPAGNRDDWITHALGILFNFYRLAVVTRAEAVMIDRTRLDVGTGGERALRSFMPGWTASDPFVRYWVAHEQLHGPSGCDGPDEPLPRTATLTEIADRLAGTKFDVDRFLIPGPAGGPRIRFSPQHDVQDTP